MITAIAPAKVNLTLEVLGKRQDGYHEIASVLQAIDLCDTITLSSAAGIALSCNVPELVSADNLVIRAAQALKASLNTGQGAAIHLEKRIPLAAGLGGGSSDAAAALKGLVTLWGVPDFPLSCLAEIGAQLGMDVPFFLYGGTALGEGRGEILTPLPPTQGTWFVLLHPQLDVARKTARMYGSLTPDLFTSGGRTRRLVDILHCGQPLDDRLLFNVFESVADGVFASFTSIRQRFQQTCDRPVHLSGAGPTLYCLARDRGDAEQLRDRLLSEEMDAYSCQSLVS